jgi:hypothetical protein
VLQREAIQQRRPLADTPPRRSRRLAVAEGFSLHAEEGSHLHPHRRGPAATGEVAPDEFPRCPRAQCLPAPSRHPPARREVPAPTGPRAVVPPKKKTKRRLDWATLHQLTFGTDVLRCPCGGRRTIRALHSTRKAQRRDSSPSASPCPRARSRRPLRRLSWPSPSDGLPDVSLTKARHATAASTSQEPPSPAAGNTSTTRRPAEPRHLAPRSPSGHLMPLVGLKFLSVYAASLQ